MAQFFQVLLDRKDQIIALTIQHLQLTLLAVLVAVIIGVPIGLYISKNKRLADFVIGIANLVQAIPSLALLGFLIPVVGIGSVPAIIMVVLYSMLPIIKNTYTGLMNINPDMLEAAKGIGLTKNQTLRLVKLPLAVPVIMSGIRIASVTAVGLMTIAAFVGAGGLGFLVFSGIQTIDTNLILLGAIPAAILALIIDNIVGIIEHAVVPSGIPNADGKIKTKRKQTSNYSKKKITIVSLILIVVASVYVGYIQSAAHKDTITIGSKNFTEQLILGNMVADLIEDRTEISVDRRLNLGGTQIVFSAMLTGDVDAYIEYTGTAFVNMLRKENTDKSTEEIFDIVKRELSDRYGLVSLPPIGFNNTYAMAITRETAERHHLKTISDLAMISDELVLGSTIEFSNREDGLIGMKELYQMNFKDIKNVDGALRYTALTKNNPDVDVVDAFVTDGLIERFDLVILEDDKQFFLPYHAFHIIREETLNQHPELEDILNELTGRITDDVMRALNYEVDVEGRNPRTVAREYLINENLIAN